jgi:hypothetical protein
MNSRMGRATESHFAVLNTKHDSSKRPKTFDADRIMNPAVRKEVKVTDHNSKEVKMLNDHFLGDEAKRILEERANPLMMRNVQADATKSRDDPMRSSTASKAG